jgi:death-on-curing protein
VIIYVDLEDALIQGRYLGFHVRDLGLLEGCLARPRTSLFGADAYESLELKAAALIHSTITSHPLIDGNKRTAWALMVTFLALNNCEVVAETDDAFNFVLSIATNKGDLAIYAQWISTHVQPITL